MNKHQLILGNALDVIPTLPFVFDAVIVDPPYNTANKNTKILQGRKARSSDFGAWDYYTHDEYLKFTNQWISAIKEKMKESGNLVIFCKLEYVSDIKRIYESNGFRHHGTIIWHKTNPAPQIRKNGFLSSCEAILWATKGFDSKKISYTFNFSKQNEMHNFFESPICMGRERTQHPTQKPKKLLEHLVKIFTKPGDTVLDCFAGSGTLAIAANNHAVNSVNIENDSLYFEILTKRISEEVKNAKIILQKERPKKIYRNLRSIGVKV